MPCLFWTSSVWRFIIEKVAGSPLPSHCRQVPVRGLSQSARGKPSRGAHDSRRVQSGREPARKLFQTEDGKWVYIDNYSYNWGILKVNVTVTGWSQHNGDRMAVIEEFRSACAWNHITLISNSFCFWNDRGLWSRLLFLFTFSIYNYIVRLVLTSLCFAWNLEKEFTHFCFDCFFV